MTNEEKYKTSKEQGEAFTKFCNCYECSECPIYAITNGAKICFTTWRNLEAETEEQSKEDLALKCEERKEMNYKVVGLNSGYELNSFDTKMEAIDWLDKVLYEVKNFNLFNVLNEIQGVCKAKIPTDKNEDLSTIECFLYKDDIPLLLINLVLKEHGIKIENK